MRRTALATLLSLGAAIGCGVESHGSERLRLRAPAWTLAGRAMELEVVASGGLAESRALLVVAIDNQVVARESLQGGRARVVVAGDELAAGKRSLSVKTGSERTVAVFRVVPVSWVAAPAAAAIALLLWLAVRWRRRRGLSR